MAQTISAAGMRIIDKLVGLPPQTISELMEKIDVTRTAVTEQLDELVAGGIVFRERERLGSRGRPRFRYSLNPDAAARLYPGNQDVVVPAIWKAICDIGGEELLDQVIEGASRNAKVHYDKTVTGETPEERFVQIMEATAPVGEKLRWQKNEDGSYDFWRRVCEMSGLNNKECVCCRLHCHFLELVTGAKVQQLANRHDGEPCCAFRIYTGE